MRRGEVWHVDLGLAAKARPCLLLTDEPPLDELALVTVVAHTLSVRGNRWEVAVPKPFLKPGAFHLQEIHSVPLAKFSPVVARVHHEAIHFWCRNQSGL